MVKLASDAARNACSITAQPRSVPFAAIYAGRALSAFITAAGDALEGAATAIGFRRLAMSPYVRRIRHWLSYCYIRRC